MNWRTLAQEPKTAWLEAWALWRPLYTASLIATAVCSLYLVVYLAWRAI